MEHPEETSGEPGLSAVLDDKVHNAQAHVVDIELALPSGTLRRVSSDKVRANRAVALIRLFGEPLSLQNFDIPPDGLDVKEVHDSIVDTHGDRLAEILNIDRKSLEENVHHIGNSFEHTPFSRAHEEFIKRAPSCTVIICTRKRPEELQRSLASLAVQDHPSFSVLVVDNSIGDEATAAVVQSFKPKLNISYMIETRPGLSRARNTGLRSALSGDIVAWLDDDEVADPMWLSELCRAFDRHPEIVGASGVVVPAELLTSAQIWFEQFGGHSKGRGFAPQIFSPDTWEDQHPLYPLPPFGVGANMAFRIGALRRIGGFDEALGAGTPAQGSEDTKMFSDLMRAGGSVAYWPTALTRHFHRRDLDGLRRQMRGYGSGLTAFYTASVLAKPSTVIDLVRLAPRALRDLFSSDGLRVATLEDDFPQELLAENRRGLVTGPWLYVRGRWQNHRMDRQRW